MSELSLSALIASVAASGYGGSDSSIRVLSIPGFESHYIGLTSANEYCLLLGSKPGSFHSPVRLSLLEARFGNWHRIHPIGEVEREEHLSVITCISEDGKAQAYFLYVCETILRILGPTPTLQEIVQVVQRLIELFSRLARPASRTLIGLFGELFLISVSRDVQAVVSAWRNSVTDRFDFSIGNVRLEVKASGRRVHIHQFSSEQCRPPTGTIGLIASLFIDLNGGGKSLSELVSKIEASLAGNNDLILKLHETISETLGESLPKSMHAHFDNHLAFESLRFYDLSQIPAIRTSIPAEVSGVHFFTELTKENPLSESEVRELSHVAAIFLPR